MLLNPDLELARMKAQADSDLAIVAVVALMCDSLDEAVERLTEIHNLVREHQAGPRSRPRTLAVRLSDNATEVSGRLLHAVTQLRDREASR